MSYPVFFSFVPHSTSGTPFHVNTHIITVTDDEESHYGTLWVYHNLFSQSSILGI